MKREIKELRLYLGYTQKEFAERLGVSISAVKQWELGYCCPTPAHTKRITELKELAMRDEGVTDVAILANAVQKKYIKIKTRKEQ